MAAGLKLQVRLMGHSWQLHNIGGYHGIWKEAAIKAVGFEHEAWEPPPKVGSWRI